MNRWCIDGRHLINQPRNNLLPCLVRTGINSVILGRSWVERRNRVKKNISKWESLGRRLSLLSALLHFKIFRRRRFYLYSMPLVPVVNQHLQLNILTFWILCFNTWHVIRLISMLQSRISLQVDHLLLHQLHFWMVFFRGHVILVFLSRDLGH